MTGGAESVGSMYASILSVQDFDIIAVDGLERVTIEGLKRLGSEDMPLIRLDLREAEFPSLADVIVHVPPTLTLLRVGRSPSNILSTILRLRLR